MYIFNNIGKLFSLLFFPLVIIMGIVLLFNAKKVFKTIIHPVFLALIIIEMCSIIFLKIKSSRYLALIFPAYILVLVYGQVLLKNKKKKISSFIYWTMLSCIILSCIIQNIKYDRFKRSYFYVFDSVKHFSQTENNSIVFTPEKEYVRLKYYCADSCVFCVPDAWKEQIDQINKNLNSTCNHDVALYLTRSKKNIDYVKESNGNNDEFKIRSKLQENTKGSMLWLYSIETPLEKFQTIKGKQDIPEYQKSQIANGDFEILDSASWRSTRNKLIEKGILFFARDDLIYPIYWNTDGLGFSDDPRSEINLVKRPLAMDGNYSLRMKSIKRMSVSATSMLPDKKYKLNFLVYNLSKSKLDIGLIFFDKNKKFISGTIIAKLLFPQSSRMKYCGLTLDDNSIPDNAGFFRICFSLDYGDVLLDNVEVHEI